MADIPAEIIKKIRKIQFQTTHLADDVLAGAYRSAFKGKGMEFEEVREYQEGDDIRAIDWNVTARMNYPYIKNFREERELTVTLVVDVSASTHYGTGKRLKSDLIAEIAATLAFSAIKNQDNVSLLLFSDTVETYLPPKKGTRHVLRVIRELLAFSPKEKGTNISSALNYLGKVQKQSGICFLISDFISPDFSHEAALMSRRHDLIGVAIIDPSESAFPEMDLVTFADLETGVELLIDTADRGFRNKQITSVKKRLSFHQTLMNKVGGELLPLYTDKPYLPELQKFFKVRQKRRR